LKHPQIHKTDAQNKLELRKLRFSTGATDQVNTECAAELAESEKRKLQDRAKKFGIVTNEDEEDRKKNRAKRFQIPIKQSEGEENQKKMERAQRFGVVTKELEDEKKQARVERFGRVLTEEGDGVRKKFKAF